MNSRNNIIMYQYFNVVMIGWLVVFNLFFLRNAIYRFLIEELKISAVTLTIMSVYMLVIYVNNLLMYFKQDKLFVMDTYEDIMNFTLFIMDLTGIALSMTILPLFLVTTYYVYMEMREFIVLHLDGNRFMWQNFIDITQIRGTLKLDLLANLEFFSSLALFSL